MQVICHITDSVLGAAFVNMERVISAIRLFLNISKALEFHLL